MDKSAEALDSLLTGIESCLIEEDLPSVKALGRTLAKSMNKIEQILQPVEKCK